MSIYIPAAFLWGMAGGFAFFVLLGVVCALSCGDAPSHVEFDFCRRCGRPCERCRCRHNR